ncbi:hypothetical protein [Microbispora rosea]|uniref:hypothetical protein n=1 Tax=Microbispora rosea TaxID=58117 RepID=UPI00379B7E57
MTSLAPHLAAAAAGWSPENWVALIASAGALLGAAVTGTLAYRSSVRTNKTSTEAQERMAEQSATIERAKVVADAFEAAKQIYDHAISELREELDRVRAQHEKALEQLDRLSEKLQAERGTTQEVRDELHRTQREMGEMRTRMQHMDRVITLLRRQLIEAGLTPSEHLTQLEGA